MSELPSTKLLSANELIAQIEFNSDLDPNVLVRGLKDAVPTNSPEEQEKIRAYHDDLRSVLSMERISRKQDRSRACLENGQIRIVKRMGKWSLFGKAKHLQPHEALFLMEINRLEIFSRDVIVSLEQAYHIFLRSKHSSSDDSDLLTIAEYMVYSQFMRFGCNIQKFREDKCQSPIDSEDNDESMNNASSGTVSEAPDHLYVWNYLYELLGHRKTLIAPPQLNSESYNRIKSSMNQTIQTFRDASRECEVQSDIPEASMQTSYAVKRKRSLDHDSNTQFSRKSAKTHHDSIQDGQYYGSGSISDFMVGDEFEKFKEIFDKINVIQLKAASTYDDDVQTSLRFSFDFWVSKDNIRPLSTDGPNFRIIIQESAEKLPSNEEIFKLYNSQTHKAAIILICFNEELSFQSYIYRFTA